MASNLKLRTAGPRSEEERRRLEPIASITASGGLLDACMLAAQRAEPATRPKADRSDAIRFVKTGRVRTSGGW